MKIRPIGKVLSCPQIDSYGNRHYGMAQVLFFNIPISETIFLWLLGYQAVRVCCRRDIGRLAGGAEAVEFKFVGLNGKAVFSGHGFLQVFNLAVVKFHNLPAFRTNQMVVMAFVGDVVELGLGAEMAFLGQAGVAKEFEGSVDRGEADMGVFLG